MGNSTSNPKDPNAKRHSNPKKYNINQDYKLTQNILGKGGSSHVVEAIPKKNTQTIIHEKRNSKPKALPPSIGKQPSIIQEEKTIDFDDEEQLPNDDTDQLTTSTNTNTNTNTNNNHLTTLTSNNSSNTGESNTTSNNINRTDTPKSNRSSDNKIIPLTGLYSNNSNKSDTSNDGTPKLGSTPKYQHTSVLSQTSLKNDPSIKLNPRISAEKCAIKIIPKKSSHQTLATAESLFTREISILEELQGHPNILQLFDHRETKQNFYIITQLCNGGSLMKRIQTHEKEYRINEENGCKIFKDILSCIEHCHNKNIVHCDLKPGKYYTSM